MENTIGLDTCQAPKNSKTTDCRKRRRCATPDAHDCASPEARDDASPQARDSASPQARDCTTSREPSSSRSPVREPSSSRLREPSSSRLYNVTRALKLANRSAKFRVQAFQPTSQSRLAMQSMAKSNRPRERVPSREPIQARDTKRGEVKQAPRKSSNPRAGPGSRREGLQSRAVPEDCDAVPKDCEVPRRSFTATC